MAALELLANEFVVSVTTIAVWQSIGLALALGAVCLALGIGIARVVGLLAPDAPAGDTVGVGLASGLTVITALWAGVRSGGQSAFTPVAVGFAVAVGLSLVRRARTQTAKPASDPNFEPPGPLPSREPARRSLLVAAGMCGVFIVAIALLYGSTLAPSPRDGVQPVEFVDEAYYAVLARDLARTGMESNQSPSGFDVIPGAPKQVWYHWGEMWLSSAVMSAFGAEPMHAYFLIVLPLVLIASAAMAGTITRRIAGTNSRAAYALGFVSWLFLAPVPVIPGPFFSSWAVGMVFGVVTYGMGAVALLLAAYAVVTSDAVPPWPRAIFGGSAIGFIVPAHIAIAVLGTVTLVAAWALRALLSLLRTRQATTMQWTVNRTTLAAFAFVAAGLAWGLLTEHGLIGGTGTAVVSAFNSSWRDSVLITLLGAGVFWAIPVAWFLSKDRASPRAWLYVGTIAVLGAGAIGWGARLGEFTMFYLYFGAIAVIATPVAAIAVRMLWERLRGMAHPRLAVGLVVLLVIQLEVGALLTVFRLQLFGANTYEPIPQEIHEAIRRLPDGAKLAYTCQPYEEVGYGTPRLLSIDAHTGARIIPMCFEAETLSNLIGAEPSEDVENLFFERAPQRRLYPDLTAKPSPAAVEDFLREHGVGYIYVDAQHPNRLVDDARPLFSSGTFSILKLP